MHCAFPPYLSAHLVGQLEVTGEVLGAERDGSNAGAGRADGGGIHHAARRLYPWDYAQPVAEAERAFDSAELRIDAAHVVCTLHLGRRERVRRQV